MKERIFITKAKEHTRLEEFLRRQFVQAKCGAVEVQYTPVATRIIIHTTTPGLVIGAGGERIRETAELLKAEYGIENPQIDVQKIQNPDLDAHIVAQAIAAAIESGVNYKRLGNYHVQKIMHAGAIGCEIVITGKVSGQRSRKERFAAGYLKKAGKPAETDVLTAFALANPRLGNIGITVKIMIRHSERLKETADRLREEATRESAPEPETAETEEAAEAGPEAAEAASESAGPETDADTEQADKVVVEQEE